MAAAAILNFKKFSFGHVTVIRFYIGPIWCSVPNFIKIGRFLTEIWRLNDFQNGGRPPSWILKICSFCHVSSSTYRSASSYKISLKSDNRSMSYGQKSDFQDGGRRHLEFKKNSNFGHVTVMGFNICCSVSNFIKITRFFTEIWDMAIFKMAVVRHLGFVVTSQYSIAGHIFVVQISSWNFMLVVVVVSEILAVS